MASALLVALIVIAVVRSGLNEFGSLVFRAAVIVIAVVLGWTYVNRSAERDKADERRALTFLLSDPFPGRDELRVQADVAQVVGWRCPCGCPSFALPSPIGIATASP